MKLTQMTAAEKILFVSMVNFEGKLLAMTDAGSVWRFEPGFDASGMPNGVPNWTLLSGGPTPPDAAPGPRWHATDAMRLYEPAVKPITEIPG